MKGMASSPFTPKQPKGGSTSDVRPPRRRSRSCSSASSLSTSPSSLATTPCPSPSPAGRVHSVPFSWEQQPGVPKKYATSQRRAKPQPTDPLLPLPPPARSKSATSIHSRKRPESRSSSGSADSDAAADPFAAALAECSKDRPAAMDVELEEFWRKGAKAGAGRRGTIAAAIGGRLALADLFGSCKAACTVAESTIRIPRPGDRDGSYGFLLNRRAG